MRLNLDTNVWSFLAEKGEGRAFDRLAKARGWVVVLPPATLLEASRTSGAVKRRGILATMTGGPRRHLRSEAAGESDEFVSEARRLRPAWIRPTPIHVGKVAKLDALWTRRVPRMAKLEPDVLALMNAMTKEHETRDQVLSTQEKNQVSLRSVDDPLDVLDLQDIWAGPNPASDPSDALGLPASGRCEAWRWQSAGLFWAQLASDANYGQSLDVDTTLADWIEPWVDLARVRADRGDFNKFWYQDVEASGMVRNWIRWAVATAQLKYRLGRGNPSDEQQAAYLPDSDVYVTADSRFSLVLKSVARHSPVRIADTVLVDRNAASAVEALGEAI